jgi:hypothetical protein
MSLDTIVSPDNLDHFEIMKAGTGFFPAVTTSNPGAGNFTLGHGSTTIFHGLGYTPVIMAFLSIVGSGRTYPMPLNIYSTPTTATQGFVAFECYSDENNTYLLTDIIAYGASFAVLGSTYQAQYYLMREKIKRG